MYLDLISDHTICFWKLKVPWKIRIFMWFLYRKILLTKDNPAKSNQQRNKYVVFVIKMKQFNIYFLSVLLQRYCATLCICLLVSPQQKMLRIYLELVE
jgi:hypothetical protein